MNRLSPQLAVVVTTVVAGGLVAVTPARILVLLVFAVTIPGLGWAWRLRLPDTGDALLLAITISVCLLVVVGEGMALLRVWSVKGAFLVLAAIAFLGVAPLPSHLFVRVADQSMTLLRVGRTRTGGAVVRRDRGSWWPPVLLSWIGVMVLALVVREAPTALRAPLVIGYVLIVPGLACVRLVRLPNRLAELALGVGLSLALAVVVAQAIIYLHVWSPVLGIAVLVIIASLASCAELLTGHWPQPTVKPPDGGETGLHPPSRPTSSRSHHEATQSSQRPSRSFSSAS